MSINDALFYIDAEVSHVNVIEKDTERMLREKGLWENEDAWTEEVMYQLARFYPRYSFEQILLSVQEMAQNRMIHLMNTYALTVINREHVEDALEYAVQFQQIDVLERLLLLHGIGNAFKWWCSTYKLLLDILKGKLSCEEVVQRSSNLMKKVDEPVLQFRLMSMCILAEFYRGNIGEALSFIEKLPHLLFKHVKPGFVRSTIMHRVSLIRVMHVLYEKGDVEQAERDLLKLKKENIPEIVLAACYHLLGIATLFEDDDRCIAYFHKANFYASNLGLGDYRRRILAKYIPFARNVRKEKFDISEGVEVLPEEKIHQYLVRGELKNALSLADQLSRNGHKNILLTLYWAKASQDIERMLDVYGQLFEENHAYLAPYVQQEISHLQNLKDSQLERAKWEAQFSIRELEVLDKIYRGYSQKDAAEMLCIELQTFKNHVTRILQKSGIRSSKEIVLMAKKNNWI
ncbi:AimR family lysis-lysogeny pheromone receptor [Shouchella lonarensis]|uniref:Regulatory protein, luxR family n=1 Tax=Shouchella lonarensis TaxID=1464122 RepID=A0A1G6GU51_9BACI|nr:AimR family lysis-lysogeny pheromone receptor [Shouchella lonarensis]SDB85494.1 regulatory protein, luxR family [Shouchella lonarensis]